MVNASDFSNKCPNEKIHIFLSEYSFIQKVRVFTSQVMDHIDRRNPKNMHILKRNLQRLARDIEASNSIRNKYVHSNWFDIDQDNWVKVKTVSGKKGVFHQLMEVTPEDIEIDESTLDNLTVKLESFQESLKFE